MTKEECRVADWATVGYHDGAAGWGGDRIDAHRKACAEFGVRPDLDGYLSGRNRGIREFCRPPKGYSRGLEGDAYDGVCPLDLEADFIVANQEGLRIYAMEQEVRRQESDLRSRQQRLDRVREEIASSQSTMVGSNDPAVRAAAFARIRPLNMEERRLEREADDLRARIQELKRNVLDERFGPDSRYR